LSQLRLVRSRHHTSANKGRPGQLGIDAARHFAGSGQQSKVHTRRQRANIHLLHNFAERFINGLGTEYVAQLLNLSRRQYFREQNQAVAGWALSCASGSTKLSANWRRLNQRPLWVGLS
jgi:hypothetical protein